MYKLSLEIVVLALKLQAYYGFEHPQCYNFVILPELTQRAMPGEAIY